MTPELTALTLATLLLLAQFLHVAALANMELGTGYFLGPRDREPDGTLSPRTARLRRAYENHREWLLPFAVAAILVAVNGKGSGLTAACAWTYLAARVAYVPAYALGLVPWRSVIWAVGFLATLLMLVAVILG
jgi:uncharacterized MAPEG superfamily protein